ncbi:MAG: hypothetical protein WA432_01665 [Candidatus Babeliaceae bacterium]
MKKVIFSCRIILSILFINPLFGGFFQCKTTSETIEQLKNQYGHESAPEKYQQMLEEGCLAMGIQPNAFELLKFNSKEHNESIGTYKLPDRNIKWLNCDCFGSENTSETYARKSIYKGLLKINKKLDIYKNIGDVVSCLGGLAAGMGSYGLSFFLPGSIAPFKYYISMISVPPIGIAVGMAMNGKVSQLIEKHESKMLEREVYRLFLKGKRFDDIKICLKTLIERDIETQIARQKDKNKIITLSKDSTDMCDYVTKQSELQNIYIRPLQEEINGILKQLENDYNHKNKSLNILIT